MTLRRQCQWLHGPIPIDGRGPIPPGVEVSDGLCGTCSPLAQLGVHVGKGNAWLRRLLLRIAQLEGDGRRHFGGTAVLAWFLCERAKPAEQLTKAKIAQLRRIAGSTENYRRLLRIATLPPPKRLRGGWTAQEVVSYVAGLVAEKQKERENHGQ